MIKKSTLELQKLLNSWVNSQQKLTLSIILKISYAAPLAFANASMLGDACPILKAPINTEKKT